MRYTQPAPKNFSQSRDSTLQFSLSLSLTQISSPSTNSGLRLTPPTRLLVGTLWLQIAAALISALVWNIQPPTIAHKCSSSSRFAMSSVLCFPPYCAPKLKVSVVRGLYSSSSLSSSSSSFRVRVKASLCPIDEPILKEALKEPVAFMGGIFAGLLRLDLNEDPLKEWVARTVEASGITAEEIATEKSESEEGSPQQIEIE